MSREQYLLVKFLVFNSNITCNMLFVGVCNFLQLRLVLGDFKIILINGVFPLLNITLEFYLQVLYMVFNVKFGYI